MPCRSPAWKLEVHIESKALIGPSRTSLKNGVEGPIKIDLTSHVHANMFIVHYSTF